MDSVWSVWWHPRRALDEMVEMRRENEELRKQLEENRRVRTELQAGLSESRRVQEDLTELRRTLEGEVARLQGLNADQAQRLKDWEDAQSEMERVAAKMEKMVSLRERMQEMRREYEERIAKLERQLWSSRSGGLKYATPHNDIPDPSESELLGPGETPFAPPLPIQMAKPRPKLNPPADDSDWLLSLPDTF